MVATVALLALVAYVYSATIGANFVVWDDDDHVYQNPHIVAADGYVEGWKDWRNPGFYPLTFTTFFWEWRLSGGQPWLFHLDNVLLHAASGVLAAAVATSIGVAPGVAWAAAGLWALHPVEVASVAWVAERKNVLCVAFYLGALLAYARALDGSTRWWALSLVLAVASLLSKATAVTLPFAVVLLHWTRAARFDGRALARIAPYFVAAVTVGLLHVSRESVTPTLGLATRIPIAARAVWFYVGKFLWPQGLVAMYPRWSSAEATPGLVALGALLVVAAVAVWQRRRVPRVAWFAGAFFLVNIALVVGVVWFPYMRYSFVADHLAYTANVGLALLVALGGAAVLRHARAPDAVAVGVTLAAWVVLAALARQQVAMWRDTDRLWAATLAVNPDSALAHNNLGVSLGERGRTEEARAHFEATLRSDPDDLQAQLNLGVMAARREAWSEAIGRYKKVLRRRPGDSTVWNNLGAVAASRGQDARAEWLYRKAMSLYPEDAEIRANLGGILVRRGRLDAGVRELRTAVARDPRFAAGHSQLATALMQQERPDEALPHYEEAYRLAPDNTDILIDLTDILVDRGDLRRAVEYLRAGAARAPNVVYFHYQLASVLADLGAPEAIEHYDRAIAVAPTAEDKAAVQATVGQLLETRGQPAAATERYEAALALDADQVDAHYHLGALLAAENAADAEKHLRTALRLDPTHAQATSALGALLVREGRRREGLALLEHAVELDPDDATLRATLARMQEGGR